MLIAIYYVPFAPLGLLEAGAQGAPYRCTFQTGSKLDFVHLSGLSDGGNQALEKSVRDFNHLVFSVDL